MPSLDHQSPEPTQPSYPKSSAPGPFFKELYDGWKSLGPGNMWFWIGPLLIICAVGGILRSALG